MSRLTMKTKHTVSALLSAPLDPAIRSFLKRKLSSPLCLFARINVVRRQTPPAALSLSLEEVFTFTLLLLSYINKSVNVSVVVGTLTSPAGLQLSW